MAIAFINDLAANGNGVLFSIGITNAYAPTSGNLVIAIGSSWESGGPAGSHTLADTRGNTIPSPTVNITGGASRITVWVFPNLVTGGAGTFKLTGSSGTLDFNLDVYEYSGCDLAGTIDGTPATNSSGTGTSIASGNLVTTGTGSLIFSTMFDQSHAEVVSHTLGGNQRLNNQNTGGAETSDQMDKIGNAGTYADTASWSSASLGNAIALFAIKAAASGGSGGPNQPIMYPRKTLYFL